VILIKISENHPKVCQYAFSKKTPCFRIKDKIFIDSIQILLRKEEKMNFCHLFFGVDLTWKRKYQRYAPDVERKHWKRKTWKTATIQSFAVHADFPGESFPRMIKKGWFELFDKTDIENIGNEYERGLRMSGLGMDEKMIKGLRTSFEMGIVTTLKMVEDRVVMKDTQ
jgi:hypothetical protein